MPTKKKHIGAHHHNKSRKRNPSRKSVASGKKQIQKSIRPSNPNIKFTPSQTRNISIDLRDDNSGYKWKVEKSSKEEMFCYNYPTDLLLETIEKLDLFITKLGKYNNIRVNNPKLIPDKILPQLKQSIDNVYTYSILSSGLRPEYKYPHIDDKNLNKTQISRITKLLMHRFLHQSLTLSFYYVNEVYDLLPIQFDKNYKILNICHHFGYTEACIYKYINQTNLENINSNISSELLAFIFSDEFKTNKLQQMKQIYKYENYDRIEHIWTPDELTNKTRVYESSKDLCFLDVHMFLKDYKYNRINYNHQLLLGGLILALTALKRDGKLLLSLAGISSKFSQDLIVVINRYFDKMTLFKTELYKPHYNTYFIACYGFRNKPTDNFDRDIQMMTEIYREMYNIDKTGGLEYTSNDPIAEQKLGIKHSGAHKGYTYFNSLLEPNGSLLYDLITRHIKDRLLDYSQFLDAMNFYFDNVAPNKEEHHKYQMLNYYKSIQIANYLNLPINPVIDIYKLKKDITIDIYQNLYGLDTTVYFKFRQYPNKLEWVKPKLELSNDYIFKQILKMNSATRLFDTRNLDNYEYLKSKLRFYEHSLNKLLMDNFNTGIPTKNNRVIRQPSRAWIKMYEIAEITQLIPRAAKKYKAFCFCEAPGNFILAINHYVKTRTDIKDFDWVAQSYNPNSQAKRDYHVIGDDYELMKNYPDKWDFGPKNTGDITDSNNIKYYGTIYNDVDLITADCGTDWGDSDIINSKLMYGQLLFILNNLPVGKNFVIKYYVPYIHYPAFISLFYIIYQSFGEISFYKPLQNAWSPEFYLVGKDFKGINKDLLQHLFYIMDNYNPYLSPIELNKIPDTFYKQLEKVVSDIVARFVFYIERYIYYIDIIEEGQNPKFNLIEQHINLRNQEWIKTFKIRKIKDADKI